MVDYLPRSAWNAAPAKAGPGPLTPARVDGVVVHWPGSSDTDSFDSRAEVAAALRGWQRFHQETRGWSDIAYQVAVDQAGRAWELRGLRTQSGANGNSDLNERYGAILLVLVKGEQPSEAMKATTREVVADFRRIYGDDAAEIKPHSAVRPDGTDCPGPAARAAIVRGEFEPWAEHPEPPTDKDWLDMATPKQIEDAVAVGAERALRNVLRDFYKDEAGTGDTIRDETRAQNQAVVNAIAKAGTAVVDAIKASK